MAWTEERIERLKVLWAKGLSCSQCAAELGGITRNAVIGKVSRLGLPGRATVRSHRTAAEYREAHNLRRRAEAKDRPTRLGPSVTGDLKSLREALRNMDAEPPSDVGTLRKGVLEIEPHDCRWPIGDPSQPDFHFCGRTKVEGISYCEFHAQLAFQAPVRRTVERPYLKDQITRRSA